MCSTLGIRRWGRGTGDPAEHCQQSPESPPPQMAPDLCQVASGRTESLEHGMGLLGVNLGGWQQEERELRLPLAIGLGSSGVELSYREESPREQAPVWVCFLKQGLKVADLLWFRRGCCHLALESQVPIVTGHL